MQLNIDLALTLQITLIILIIAAVVAVIQLIIILLDIRQATKKIRKVVSLINVAEYLVDEKDVKQFFKKCKRGIFRIFEILGKALGSLFGEKKAKKKSEN